MVNNLSRLRARDPLMAVLMVLIVAPQLLATRARMDAFNGLNDFVEDEENIFYYPSMIVEHANIAIVNLGRVTGTGEDLKYPLSYRSADGILALGSGQKYGVIGMSLAEESFPDTVSYLEATTSSDPLYDLVRGWDSDDKPKELYHHFDMAYAYSWTPRLVTGFRIHRGVLSTTTRSQVDSLESGVTVLMDGEKYLKMLDLIGSTTVRINDRFTLYLAGGPRWHDYRLRTTTPDERYDFRDSGHISWSARLKIVRQLGERVDLLGHARYQEIDISGAGFQDQERRYSRQRLQKTIAGGIALRYHRTRRFDLTAGVLFARQKLNDTTDFVGATQAAPSTWQNVESTRRIIPRTFAAFEVYLKRWFMLRLGVAETVNDTEEFTEEQVTDVVMGEARQDMTSQIVTNIGFGVSRRSLFVDVWLHSSAPYSPSAFIAGTGLTNPVMEVSTGYAF